MSQQIDVNVFLELHLYLHINEDPKYILHLGRKMTFNQLPSKGSVIKIGILSTDSYKEVSFEVDYLMSKMTSNYVEFQNSLVTVPKVDGFHNFLNQYSLSEERDQILDDFTNLVKKDGWSIEVEFV
tara:strand:+ start:148 stop:525 length:378 start_codon:yes stop_codon:yes gene_type:complete